MAPIGASHSKKVLIIIFLSLGFVAGTLYNNHYYLLLLAHACARAAAAHTWDVVCLAMAMAAIFMGLAGGRTGNTHSPERSSYSTPDFLNQIMLGLVSEYFYIEEGDDLVCCTEKPKTKADHSLSPACRQEDEATQEDDPSRSKRRQEDEASIAGTDDRLQALIAPGTNAASMACSREASMASRCQASIVCNYQASTSCNNQISITLPEQVFMACSDKSCVFCSDEVLMACSNETFMACRDEASCIASMTGTHYAEASNVQLSGEEDETAGEGDHQLQKLQQLDQGSSVHVDNDRIKTAVDPRGDHLAHAQVLFTSVDPRGDHFAEYDEYSCCMDSAEIDRKADAFIASFREQMRREMWSDMLVCT